MQKHFALVVAFLSLLIAMPTFAMDDPPKLNSTTQSASTSKSSIVVLNIPASGNFKRNLTLVRRTTLQFEGDMSEDLGACNFVLMTGDITLAQGVFQKHWKLSWNTTDDHDSSKSLRILVTRANFSPVLLARIFVEVLETQPFTVKADVPKTPAKDPLLLTVTPSGTLTTDKFLLKLDGKPIEADFDKGISKVDMSKVHPGTHIVSVTAQIADSFLVLNPVNIVLSARFHVIPLPSGTMLSGSKLPLAVKADDDIALADVNFFVDDISIGEIKIPPLEEVLLQPSHLKPGDHTLYAVATTKAGEKFFSPDVPFKVGVRKAAVDAEAGTTSDTGNLTTRRSGVRFPQRIDQWLDMFNQYIADQTQSLDALKSVLHKEYFSIKSVNQSIAILKQESIFAMPLKSAIPRVTLPSQLTAENSRTLSLAAKQLGLSYESSLEANRIMQGICTILLRYDGTITNLPRVEYDDVDNIFIQARDEINKSKNWANLADSNIKLVHKRLGN